MLPRKFLSSLLVQTTLLSLWASTWSASVPSSKYISTTATITSSEPLTTSPRVATTTTTTTTTITESEVPTASPTATFSQATTLLEADTKSASTEAEAQNATKIIRAPVNPLQCYNTSKAALSGMLVISNTSNVAICPSNSKCISLEAKGLPMLGFFKVDVTLGRCVPAESCRSDLCNIMIDQIYNTTVDSCVASCCDYNLCNAVSQKTENRDQQSLMTETDTESVSTEPETEITTETSPDPCANNDCHSKARCAVNEYSVKGYDCICNENEAYYGDGFECHKDCRRKCDFNGAICPITRTDTGNITVTCKCRKGFIRNGRWCSSDPCNKYEECFKSDTCATRWVDFGRASYPVCRCKNETLFVREGCKMDPCDNACSPHASCVQNDQGTYQCVCQEKYCGDGYTCTKDGDCGCECSPDAYCEYSFFSSGRSRGFRHQCHCREGFYGDGHTCSPDPCYKKNCPIHSLCHRNEGSGTADCICDLDGRLAMGEPCKEVSCRNVKCPPQGRCVDNIIGERPFCVCPWGYCPVDGQCIEKDPHTWSC